MIPEFNVTCGTYDKLPVLTKIFNVMQVSETLIVYVPSEITNYYELYRIDEVFPETKKDLDYTEHIVYRSHKPWVDIETSFLDVSWGHHIYKLYFINRNTDVTITQYFGYDIVDPNVEKPYVYMKRDSEEQEQ